MVEVELCLSLLVAVQLGLPAGAEKNLDLGAVSSEQNQAEQKQAIQYRQAPETRTRVKMIALMVGMEI